MLPDGEAVTKLLVPSGMLGSGFPIETVERGIAMGAHAIALDGGSTDSGPHYLGASIAKTSRAAVYRDVAALVEAAFKAHIPLIIGSCGTSGTNNGVDWVAQMVRDAVERLGIQITLARIYSEQSPELIVERLKKGEVHPLPPAGPLLEEDVLRCSHIVGLMGHEPIAEAIRSGADVVLAGRSTDTAVLAAVPLMRGAPAGAVWHASKIGECGGLCTTDPTSGGVFITFDSTGFTIEPLSLDAQCTPRSVAAHMLYENADPVRMREPGGLLDTSNATYTALDERIVRVEGSQFQAMDPTIKLEGAAPSGYETMSLVGIKDGGVLEGIEQWDERLRWAVDERVSRLMSLTSADYKLSISYYGWNAVLGELDEDQSTPREVGVVVRVRAGDQETANAIAKIANPLLLHLYLPGMTELPSFAFHTSPPEVERGLTYEFVLQHVVEVSDEHELFRTELEKVG